MRFVLSKLHSILLLASTRPPSSPQIVSTTTKFNPCYNRLLLALKMSSSSSSSWIPNNPEQAIKAKHELELWPLDKANAELLNEVHPFGYTASTSTPHEMYDLIAIGAGAGGLVSSKQSARRGAKSAMISEKLAGGDCLNVGCVPSKALLHAAKSIQIVQRYHKEHNNLSNPVIPPPNFPAIMKRLRELRTQISPADGHPATEGTGAHVYQGRGFFVDPDTIQVNDQRLKFKTAVIATGGRPRIPTNIPGLQTAPYTTNEILFNLETLPPRMVIIGSGVVALEMAYCFALLGSNVTVLQRSSGHLFGSKFGDEEASQLIQTALEEIGVTFVKGAKIEQVTTLRERPEDTTQHPLLQLTIESSSSSSSSSSNKEEDNTEKKLKMELECECLLVATGRTPNIESLGLDKANVEYMDGKGIVINDLAQSPTNPKVYAVGDCVAGVPRLTHCAGEMAKLVVQNSLFDDDWKVSSLIIPAVMYTTPEYATVGIGSIEMAISKGMDVDMYRGGLEHNDRAILEENNVGFCKIFCQKGTDTIVGATIVADRAGEMINEITLAMKNGIGLRAIGRNIHAYPTTGEAVMGCGIQYINSHWKTMK